ncbi:Hypothetical Protein FCC1311_047382 [Hondaea fermentalgiana]|uniref:DUF218 domain-containing protein n=1 Tax=Hondaea fermentalgiana TaxID=2315210 RepID=A0A2R5GD88_9STRA|nr:Hypothetical Protein FCC1311_047382 [Hondaea fermentalgiana]|eukprot:GBG28515.1 Hypothetical Protein FCC1311_047382 [Hondaea fermentalgiana]
MIALFGFMAVALGGLFWRSLTWLLFGPNADDFVVQRHGVSVRSPSAELAPFDRTAARSARNLILVACHSITVGESLEGVDVRDDRWMLVDYQKHASMPQAFTGHIRKGIELALEDPHALVIFSGGQTRLHAGPKSEANSYFFVADHFGWWSSRAAKEVRPRAALEEYSTDSLENLLFSLCRFHELSGSYPKHVTVVGYTFKQERFRDLHRAALRYPLESFRYVGVDPDTNAFRARLPQLEFFESTASLAPFREDPYGCHSEVLRTKRVDRNPFSRQPGFILSCPEISTLLRYCERKLYPVGELPWDS